MGELLSAGMCCPSPQSPHTLRDQMPLHFQLDLMVYSLTTSMPCSSLPIPHILSQV